jgi:hypothetical protein
MWVNKINIIFLLYVPMDLSMKLDICRMLLAYYIEIYHCFF